MPISPMRNIAMTTPAEHPAPTGPEAEFEVVAPWFVEAPEPAETAGQGPAPKARPARLAVGLASLAAERVREGAGTSEPLVVTVGLLGRTADQSVAFARRVGSPPIRVARRGAGWAARLPGVKRLSRPVARAREGVARVATDARARGQTTVAAGRDEAIIFLQTTVDDGLAWAQANAVPRVVDGMMPYLVDKVIPKIIDGALPEIRTRVLPVMIEDLASEPRVRELMMQQSRTVIGDAADELRSSSAAADDRLESAFRRMFPGSSAQRSGKPAGGHAAEQAGGHAAGQVGGPPTESATSPTAEPRVDRPGVGEAGRTAPGG